MKKTALLITTAAIALAISVPAFAQFADVPTSSWAYGAVQSLAQAGVIQGYPDGTFGGKRAMTRYEFAEALNKAIPQIEKMIGAGQPGPAGPQGPAGAQGPAGPMGPSGVNSPEFKALQALVAEFRDELRAQGTDIDRLNADVAALGQRVAAVEAEQARVRITGEANLIWRGEVSNLDTVIDRDGRVLAAGTNPISNSLGFIDYRVGIAGKVSDNVSVKGVIAAGDYLPFALNSPGVGAGGTDSFILWNAYADAGVSLGFLGASEVTVGRFPFQLTPYTFKFVDPDSYDYVDILDNGDYIVDGGMATMKLGSVALTPFAFKPTIGHAISSLALPLAQPVLQTPLATTTQENYNTMGGARAVIGGPFASTLGLTYYRVGLNAGAGPAFGASLGQANVFGGDLNVNVGSVGVSGEYAKIDPSKGSALPSTLNTAWNGKLNFQAGKLGIGAGYTQVESNYSAAGYWARLGTLVNPVNVKGFVADLNYALTPGLSFSAAGQFLQPMDTALPIDARDAVTQQSFSVTAPSGTTSIDRLDYWRAGIKYALTSANTVDLGYEELQIKPSSPAGSISGLTGKDRFITLGIGHSFNANAGLKLLYQIIDTTADSTAATRGGVAAAQFQLKY